MHDLKSFFWVLFWKCIHFNGPDKTRAVPRFDKWNDADIEELVAAKKGEIANEEDFFSRMQTKILLHTIGR